MLTPDEVFYAVEELPQIKDRSFGDWLMKQFANACKREHRWKTHLTDKHAIYEYNSAIRMKRCIRECAGYESQAYEYDKAIEKASNILAKAMERNELAPVTYQQVMEALKEPDLRRKS